VKRRVIFVGAFGFGDFGGGRGGDGCLTTGASSSTTGTSSTTGGSG
jgi:hypothetical protein